MNSKPSGTVEQVSAMTPHNQAIFEAGKSLITESITTGREFCKFMITVSTSAIPIHLGLLKFVLPDKYTLSFLQGLFGIIPAVVFLFSSIIFTIGYFPQVGTFSLDYPSEIERERNKTIKSRMTLIIIGFSVFAIASLLMILCVAYFLTILKVNAT